jgi:hypothetical protein
VLAKLPELEQEALAARLLSELTEETGFDRSIAGTSSKLAGLAPEASAENRTGQTPRRSLESVLAEIEKIQTGMRLTPGDGSSEMLRRARAGG